jgi:hypothetical protein
MSMNYVERTGKIKYSSGLCDYVAEGNLHIHDTGVIPCKIGYVEAYVNSNELILQPILLFIQNDGVTKEGNHYYRETIDLNIRRDIACQEEK